MAIKEQEFVSYCWLESDFGFKPCDICGLNCDKYLNKKAKALGSVKPKTF